MTAPSVLKQQKQEALERSEAAALAISNEHPEIVDKVEALKGVRGRDHLHVEAARLQALADILETLQAHTVGDAPENVEPQKLEDLESLNQGHVNALRENLINDVEGLRQQSDEDLVAIDGIGKATVEKLRDEIGYPPEED